MKVTELNRQVTSELGSVGRLQGGAPAEAFGAASARAKETSAKVKAGVGNLISERAMKLKEVAEYNEAMESFTNANKSVREYVNNDVLSRKGKDAQGAVADVNTYMDKVYSETKTNLMQPRARDLFNKQWEQYREENLNSVSKFQASQYRVYLEENAKSTITNLIEDISLDPYNDVKRERVLSDGFNIIKTNFDGYGDEVVAEKYGDYTDKIYANTIANMINSSPISALRFFSANADKMKTDTRKVLEKQIKDAVVKEVSQGEADRIFSTKGTYGEAIEETKKIKDLSIRDEVVNRVNTLYSQKNRAEEELLKDTIKGSTQQLLNNPMPSLNDIPDSIPEEYKTIQKRYVERFNRDGKITTDWDVYYKLRDEMTNATDLNLYIDRIDKIRLKELIDMQKNLKDGEKAGNKAGVGEAKPADLKEVWRVYSKGKEPEGQKYQEFVEYIQRNVPKDKNVTFMEVYKTAAPHFREVSKSWFFGSTQARNVSESELPNREVRLSSFEDDVINTEGYKAISTKYNIDPTNNASNVQFIQSYYVPAEAYLKNKGIPLTEDNLDKVIKKAFRYDIRTNEYLYNHFKSKGKLNNYLDEYSLPASDKTEGKNELNLNSYRTRNTN